MEDFAVSLKDTFTITPWLLIVPLVTGILIARKVPSIITLFISTMLAGIYAVFSNLIYYVKLQEKTISSKGQ